jgi:hypothetical protein
MQPNRRLSAFFIAVLMLLATAAEARADQGFSPPGWSTGRKAFVLPGLAFRNGDYFVVDALGLALFNLPRPGRCLAATGRAELGVGGSAVAIGVATNLGEAPCELGEAFLESGLISLEARVERMYGSSWQRTTYLGAQISLASMWTLRLSLGWMVDPHDAADNHVQFGVGALF